MAKPRDVTELLIALRGEAVREIVRLVDGMPLAIELAENNRTT